jgi:DNA ligase-1
MSSADLEAALEEATRVIKCVYCESPNYEVIIPAALRHGVGAALMERCQLTPGVPVKAMLAKPTKGISEVLTRFAGSLFTLEYKYDGERAQIHGASGTVGCIAASLGLSLSLFMISILSVSRLSVPLLAH